MRIVGAAYKLLRLVLAITTPEVTMFDLALMFLGWLLRRGPPIAAG